MSRPRTDPVFRKALGRQLKEAFDKQDRTAKEIARELGISRQAFYQYLDGIIVPGQHRLPLVLKLLGLSQVTYRKHVFGAEAFGPTHQQKRRGATQLSLLDALETVRDADVVVKILNRRSDSLRLGVEIKFAARL